MGSCSSAVALAVGPIAAQNHVLFLSGPAASDGITGLNRYTFRAGRQTYEDVLAANSFLAGAGKNVVVFAQDYVFGQGNYAAVNAVLGGKGHKVDKVLVPLSATDFTPYAQQAKAKNPDLLFVAWAGTSAAAMWRALDQQGVLDSATVVTGLAERATWGSYGDASSTTKIKFLSHYVSTAPKNPINDWLVNKMRSRNQVPDIFTPDGFVSAQMLQRAISKADGDDVEKMITALEGWSFLAPKGSQRIRPEDHAMLQPMFQAKLEPRERQVARHGPEDGSRLATSSPRSSRFLRRKHSRRWRQLLRSSSPATSASTSAAHISSPMSGSRSREGEFLGIIGPNGAGKTSLFNLLTGLYRPTAGRVELAGRDITHAPPYRRTQLGLGRTFQLSLVFPVAQRARERPPRRRGQARRSSSDLASGLERAGTRSSGRTGRSNGSGSAERELTPGGRARARRQAQARAGDDARARPTRDPARRADGGHRHRGDAGTGRR